MKTYDVKGAEVSKGIVIVLEPYPHIVLGEGGNKRATWIPLGKRDAEFIIVRTPFTAQIEDVSVIALKDAEGKPNGKHLIVAPRNGGDNRILVLWRVSSGYRGSASISAGEGVTVIASDFSWHSERGSLGETAEMLAILKPGQELRASLSGRGLKETEGKLTYDGAIKVIFGGEEMEDAMADEVDGDLL